VRVFVHPPLCFCNEQISFVCTVRLLLFDFRCSVRHFPCGVLQLQLACRLPAHCILVNAVHPHVASLSHLLRRQFMTTSNSAASAAAPAASDSKLDVASSKNSTGRAANRGAFLLFEGLDRGGKSTQCSACCCSTRGHQCDSRVQRSAITQQLKRFGDRSTKHIGKMLDAYLRNKSDCSLPIAGSSSVHLPLRFMLDHRFC